MYFLPAPSHFNHKSNRQECKNPQSAKVINGCLLVGGKEKEGGFGFVCFSCTEPKEVLTALRWADR